MRKAQSLLELLLVIALLAVIMPALFYGFISSRYGSAQQQVRLQAVGILKEAEEAVRNVREKGWNSFAVNGNYYATISGSNWILNSTSLPGYLRSDGFTELITIADTLRDDNGIIGQTGTIDPSTKTVNITISWANPFASSINTTLYITRYMDNISKIYTTKTDFNAGTTSNTAVATTNGSLVPDDGQVNLGAGGGGGDWCVPSKSITSVDLPKSGVANAITAIEGTVFAGTGDNASGVSFAKVSLTTNQDPPIANIAATFDGYKTNSVFGESNYAYLTTNTSHSQVVIIDLTQYSDPPTNSKYKKIGSMDLGTGSVQGESIYVSNNKAYVTDNDQKFYIYDITNRASPVLLNAGGLELNGNGNKVLVVGSYAYIATSSTTYQMEIVNISNPANPSIIGKLNLGSSQSGVDLYVNTSNTTITRAYLVTTPQSGKKDFYIVNVGTPSNPKLTNDSGVTLSSYDTSGMTPHGVTVVTGNRAIIVGTGGTYQYQVIDISNETNSLSACATLQYVTGVYGISSVLQANGYAYSYIITGDSSAELKIILGGAGGNNYSSSGTYISAPYDTGYTTAFNRFSATVNKPDQTDIKIQVGVADQVAGSCSGVSYTYVGPDKTNPTTTYYTAANGQIVGAIPYITTGSYKNPGRCFSYKTFFSSTDNTQTPILYDLTVNYSP